MNFFKALISWKLWLGIILGLGLLVGLWFFTFQFLNKITNHGVEIEVPDLSQMTIHEAMTKLDEMDLQYEIDSIKFTEDHPPFSILDFYPAAGFKVKPGRRIFIKSNPSTWRPVQLPDFIDKSKRLAMTQLKMRGFVVGDTIYVRDPAKDAVLAVLYHDDTIQPGKLLPRGSKVDLVLGRGLRIDVSVPTVEGLTLQEAKEMLKTYYFDLGQIYYLGGEEKDSIMSKVVFQDPPPQDIYDEGLPVSLWLSMSDKSELNKELDSLRVLYRRKVEDDDSLFLNSVNNAKDIDIKDLPEEIRNQVKYDQNTNENMRPDKPKEVKRSAPKIDTTGITIE